MNKHFSNDRRICQVLALFAMRLQAVQRSADKPKSSKLYNFKLSANSLAVTYQFSSVQCHSHQSCCPVLEAWPWPRGSSRTTRALALALDDKVLALALALREKSWPCFTDLHVY